MAVPLTVTGPGGQHVIVAVPRMNDKAVPPHGGTAEGRDYSPGLLVAGLCRCGQPPIWLLPWAR